MGKYNEADNRYIEAGVFSEIESHKVDMAAYIRKGSADLARDCLQKMELTFSHMDVYREMGVSFDVDAEKRQRGLVVILKRKLRTMEAKRS